MQFNRTEYKNGNYDKTSHDEMMNEVQSRSREGLDWNIYISNYVLKCLRSDLMYMTIGSASSLMQYVPMIQLGMFHTVSSLLSATSFTDEKLEAFRTKWIPLFQSANDIEEEAS